MSYEEYYNKIINIFHNSIKTLNNELHTKIFNTLINWYKSNYEKLLLDYFEKKQENNIIMITKEIQKICDLNDYEKIQNTYQCVELDELNKISNVIFELVKQMIKNNNVDFKQSNYEEILNKFELLEIKFPKIIFKKFEFIRSECVLDLNYLLNNGNVQAYSLRTYDYLKNEDLI